MRKARIRVVILASPSLFAEGLASRLRQHEDRAEVVVIDSRHPEALAQAVAARPTAVILDASDAAVTADQACAFLVASLPSVRLVRLDPQTERIQVVTSEERTAGEVRDLIEVLTPEF